MIGCGLAAKPHVYGYTALNLLYDSPVAKVTLKVICDVDEEKARAGMERYGFEEYSTDWRKAIARADIDLVDICTPNDFHCEMAVAAAEAGKMIYCETPLAPTVEQARKMCEAAAKAGVRTAVSFDKRRHGSVVYAKKLIDDGFIGDPIYLHSTYLQSSALDPNMPAIHTLQAGTFRDMGCHSIDLARYLVGEFDEVCAVTDTIIKERPAFLHRDFFTNLPVADPSKRVTMTAADFGMFMAKFKNGVKACFEATTLASGRGEGCGFEIYGTKGSIVWEARHGAELKISSTGDPKDQQGYKIVEMSKMAGHPNYFWVFGGFGLNWGELKAIEIHDILENDKPFSPDFNEGLLVAEICDSLYRSANNGSIWVKPHKKAE
jgi:predicted dehydrogenase